jgi:hypothetical protein
VNRHERRKAASQERQERRERVKSPSEPSDETTVIKVVAGRYFALIAFLYGEQDRDWLASAWRDHPEDEWHLNFRFRYYGPLGKKTDPWAVGEQADKKQFYSATVAATVPEDEVIRNLRNVAEGLRDAGYNDQVDFIEPKSDDPAYILYLLRGRPWVHGRLLKDMPS